MESALEYGNSITFATIDIYKKILDIFGAKLTRKFLKDASQEEKDAFIQRMKDAQIDKLTARLDLIINRAMTDHHFLSSYNDIMSQFKSIEELKQDNDIANNHLQSVENERSKLQRATDLAVDKVECLCEAILEHKLITVNNTDEQ